MSKAIKFDLVIFLPAMVTCGLESSQSTSRIPYKSTTYALSKSTILFDALPRKVEQIKQLYAAECEQMLLW